MKTKDQEIIKSNRLGNKIFRLPKKYNDSFGDMYIEVSDKCFFVGVGNSRSKRKRELLFAWSDATDSGTLYYMEKSAGDNTSISIDSCGINAYIGAPFEVNSVVRHELGIINDRFDQKVEDHLVAKNIAVSIARHPRVATLVNDVLSAFKEKDPSVGEKVEASKAYQIFNRFMFVEEVNDFTPDYIGGIFSYHEIPRSDCDLPSEKEDSKGQFVKKQEKQIDNNENI